ncbi:response regulator [Hyella patelloides]|uniref:response regulator n=1 Tax=Hyella patelloides TaxID=1982969 RepID=UPI00119D53BE|nr:response regulator [Hyella patelloides]
MSNCLSRPIEILLVEDSLIDIKVIAKVFEQVATPHSLKVVRDGVAAIAYLCQQGEYLSYPKPDLILLDLHLPRKNGLAVLEAIKSDERFADIPVIMLTVSGDQQDIAECYQRDANCYLTKPSNLQEFEQLVQIIQDFWLQMVQLPMT